MVGFNEAQDPAKPAKGRAGAVSFWILICYVSKIHIKNKRQSFAIAKSGLPYDENYKSTVVKI